MKRILILMVLVGMMSSAFAQTQRERLERHVYTLAADSLQGRGAGTADGMRAALYIAHEFESMGLKPYYEDYFQTLDNDHYHNVIGYIEGSDPALKNEYLVIGAHYDHLGVRNGKVYNGADDNASGTATVIEMARALLARKGELKRSVMLVCFDAEELGLVGSYYLVGQLNPLSDCKLMMSIDMVGWLKAGKTLRLSGCSMLKGCDKILRQTAEKTHLAVTLKGLDNSLFGGTDSDPFARREVPALHVTTGLKSPYHKPGDDAELIDYEGLDQVTRYLTEATVALANEPQLQSSGRLALKHQSKIKPFEAGVLAGFGRMPMNFSDGGFTANGQLGFHGGALVRYNMDNFALQLEGYYDYARTQFPLEADPYNEKGSLVQQSIIVPLTVQVQFGTPIASFGIGVGAFYGRVLNTKNSEDNGWEFSPNQLGFQWNLHLRISRFLIQYEALYTNPSHLFDSGNGPKASAVRRYATIAYMF